MMNTRHEQYEACKVCKLALHVVYWCVALHNAEYKITVGHRPISEQLIEFAAQNVT